jgi:UDP-N-acetylglucosamine transferase subunit ALG13
VTQPLVVCLLGTDHHRFDRLVGWCDALATAHPDVDVLVQHGATAAPRVAQGSAFLGKQELADALARAHVAICHGGPGLISDVRAAGLLPLVVARDPELGEHVDGHQQRFVRRFATTGAIVAVDQEDELAERVAKQLAGPRGEGLDPDADSERVRTSVARFGRLVDELLAGR